MPPQPEASESAERTREKLREKLRAGKLDDRLVEIDVRDRGPTFEISTGRWVGGSVVNGTFFPGTSHASWWGESGSPKTSTVRRFPASFTTFPAGLSLARSATSAWSMLPERASMREMASGWVMICLGQIRTKEAPFCSVAYAPDRT